MAANLDPGKTLRASRSPNQQHADMNRTLVAVWALFALGLSGCASESTEPSASTSTESAQTAMLADLEIEDLVDGEGLGIQAGQRAEVHYTLWLRDTSTDSGRGEMLQSSKDTGRTFTFTIGQGSVIAGWDQGLPGMKVGGTRELRIPYRLAYGERGMPGGIPPRADLIFEIDLISIQ